MIEQVKNHCINNLQIQNMHRLNLLSRRLVEASDIVHECLSYYSQFVAIKYNKPDQFKDKLEDLKRKNAYTAQKVYTITEFLESENWQEIFNSTLINRIARLAMNIKSQLLFSENLLNEEYLVQSLLIEQSLDFNPNTRFPKLVSSLKKLLQSSPVESITDEMLLAEANLISNECNKANLLEFFNFAKSQFIKYSYPINPVDSVIENTINNTQEIIDNIDDISEEERLEIFDLIRPAVINTNYEHIFLSSLDDMKDIKGIFSSFWIIVTDNLYNIMFDDIALGKRYFFITDKKGCISTLARYDLPVTVFTEDYEELLRRFPELIQREIFIYNDQPYLSSKEFITSHLSAQHEIMFYQLNNDIFVVFIKLKDNSIITMLHTKYSLKLIIGDIQNKLYKYINTDGVIDGVFWKHDRDWWKYEDIIKSFTQTQIFSQDLDIPPLGNRINLEI
ncbi:hypothetical protein [Paenibacillus sp. IHBB 10380]|uniref:hypothetical protein n=1 Tax=Paenibacillus sp. IHBB 10380 TaxID=1566358 RepID=UPI00118612E2|nr:hypothetical protein [Paenibacillus sp. IHBB 10380]